MKRKHDKTRELIKECILFAIEDQERALVECINSAERDASICKNIKTLAEAFALVDGE